MFHLCMWWVTHSWGEEEGEKKGGGGLPCGFLRFPFPSESGVIKLPFFLPFAL